MKKPVTSLVTGFIFVAGTYYPISAVAIWHAIPKPPIKVGGFDAQALIGNKKTSRPPKN